MAVLLFGWKGRRAVPERPIEPPFNSIPIEYDACCCVMFCKRRATRVALNAKGDPMPVCDAHARWAHLMVRVTDL
jgi:hypothetical protein